LQDVDETITGDWNFTGALTDDGVGLVKKGELVISLADYDTVFDGVHDNGPALQAALDDSAHIRLPDDAIVYINTPIFLDQVTDRFLGYIIEGGRGTTIKIGPGPSRS
jgi:hypothetical protein